MSTNDPRGESRCNELDFSARIRFPQVIAREYDEIDNRRGTAHGTEPPTRVNGRPPRLTGLALSGGGVRSATFNLGVLQALAAGGKLLSFDYLSTVSGGGYVGGWWSAWLSRKERDREPGRVFPAPEDIESERDDRRAHMEQEGSRAYADRPQIKDSSINAAEDPIHHLRLFSSMMRPRVFLSADTWRVIAVISRNISLLPILLAAIIAGQSWFTLSGERRDLAERLGSALAIPGLLFIGNLVCGFLQLMFTRRWRTIGDKWLATMSSLAFLAFMVFFLIILGVRKASDIPTAVYVALGFWLVYVSARLIWWKVVDHARWREGDFWRHRLVVIQTKIFSSAVFALAVLLFAGFGYAIFDFLVTEGQNALARAGWSTFGVTVIGAAYTALKAAPSGGSKRKAAEKPSPLQRVAFAIAPPLLLVVLGIVLSWIGRQLYLLILPEPDAPALLWETSSLVEFVSRGALVSGFLFLVFALYEFRPILPWWQSLVVVVIWEAVVAAAAMIPPGDLQAYLVQLGSLTLGLLSLALVFQAILRRRIWILWYALFLAGIGIWIQVQVGPAEYGLSDPYFPQFVLAGIVSTLVLLFFDLGVGRGSNTRSLALTVIGCTIFVLIGAALGAGSNGFAALTLVGLIATILGLVLALGWLTDPNRLTMHSFYKARIIRAYMGASNARRGKATDADITDAVPGDDMLLTQLRNTERGAPYHLINTMLNFPGGSSSQARASDSFLMSKLFCGSTRTGYRPTSEYACGSISLGTAVAVSGAAASPSMGAPRPSIALSALMTLFNIRLDYWAPTPSLSYWRSDSVRLWPVYTFQQFLSRTTDLLPFCNLTDGGHYDNTGAHSLIQRGCRLIVVGECGGDSQTMLEDLRNMIRKVRIDFGTEIELDLDGLRSGSRERTSIVVGKIHYGPNHAAALGLAEEERTGTIIVVKPNLAGGEPADVRQYGSLHTDYRQRNTWYDEAQFETYRRLGEESGRLAVATGMF